MKHPVFVAITSITMLVMMMGFQIGYLAIAIDGDGLGPLAMVFVAGNFVCYGTLVFQCVRLLHNEGD